MWLEAAELLSIVPWSFYAQTTVTGTIFGTDVTERQSTDSAVMIPQVDLQNAGGAAATGYVRFELLNEYGVDELLSVNVSFAIGANGAWTRVRVGPCSFGSPTNLVYLWNTASRPPLYESRATVFVDTVGPVDQVSVIIGVRSAVFEPQRGFVLNGVPVKIRGTSNHLGFGGVGMATVNRVEEFRIAKLKDMGSNAFRTAHNPVAPELLDYTDSYGMLVWEENRFITSGVQPVASTSSTTASMFSSQSSPGIPVADPR